MQTEIRPRLRLVWLQAACLALFLFALNSALCHELFHSEFTKQMGSIESSYMSISRWAMDHHGDLTWFPEWFTGMPFYTVYQPGLHLSVAYLGLIAGWTAQHAYHFTTALAYCLGPVTLFLLCWKATASRVGAFTAGLLYTVISPASLLVPAIRRDTEGLITGRRFDVLVRYGEGPHSTAVMLIPVVLLLLHYAAIERRAWAAILAPLALAALVLTNWPGTVGLTLGIVAWLASRLDSNPRLHWVTLAVTGVLAYMVASPWIPPSLIAEVQRNAQQSDNTMLGHSQLFAAAGLAAVLVALHFAFHSMRVNAWTRFFVYYTLITGAIGIGREWFGWRLLPQPNRMQVEFEMAFCGLAGILFKLAFDRGARTVRIILALLLIGGSAAEARHFRRLARERIGPIDVTTTIEYKMARWFDSHTRGQRVFAPGNVSLWMNMFTDTPQLAGCCDQSIPSQEFRIANYGIYTGQNAGDRDAANSILWLKAYGADAIGVSGPASTEVFKPFWSPRKFDGVLPELWRDGDNVVYDLSRHSRSLAHVVRHEQVVARPPENALDVKPLEVYVNAIEAPDAPPATFRWINLHTAAIAATLKQGDLISVQVGYDKGWRLRGDWGVNAHIYPDALGMTVIDSQCLGPCKFELSWQRGGAEANGTRAASLMAFALLAGMTIRAFRKAR